MQRFWCDSSDCGHYGKTVGKLCLHGDGVLNDGRCRCGNAQNGEKSHLLWGTAVRVIDEADGSDGMKVV